MKNPLTINGRGITNGMPNQSSVESVKVHIWITIMGCNWDIVFFEKGWSKIFQFVIYVKRFNRIDFAIYIIKLHLLSGRHLFIIPELSVFELE